MKVGGGLGMHFAARFQPSTSAAKEILNQVPQVSVPQSPQLSIREVVNASLLQDAESYGPNAGLVPDGSLRSLNEDELLRQIRQLMVAGQLSQSLNDIGDILSDEHDGLAEGTESQAQPHGISISTVDDSPGTCQARTTHTDVSTSGLEGLCDICEADVPGESLGCGDKFCKECLKMYVATLRQGSIFEVRCPQQGCTHLFTEDELERYLDSDSLATFRERRLFQALLKDPCARFCPQPDCTWAVIVEPGASTKQAKCKGGRAQLVRCPVVCESCTKSFCATCRQPWHAGGCVPMKLDLDSTIQDDYRACPTCNMQVNKSEGCNAVKCMCGTEFCWLCGQPCNETVHFLPHKPCSLFKKGKMKARHRLRTYGITLLAAPLLVVPTALLGAGVAVFAMKESIATHLKNVPSPRRRKAYKAMYIGTAPVWVVGLGAIGAATLLASAAGYLTAFPLLFARERVRAERQKNAEKKRSAQADVS